MYSRWYPRVPRYLIFDLNDNPMKEPFTILVYTEDKVGLLQRVVSTISRRKLNIESLNTSESGVPGIFRFTIVVESQE